MRAGNHPPSLHLLRATSHGYIIIISQLNCYVTLLHRITHISAHRHNPEPPPLMLHLPQQREAAMARAGYSSPIFPPFVTTVQKQIFVFQLFCFIISMGA
jgi:hypothetical protein